MHVRQATRLLIALMDGIICSFGMLVKDEFLWYDNPRNPDTEGLLMKKRLWIIAVMLCVMLCGASAEEAAKNIVVYFQDGSKVLLPAEIAADEQKLADYCSKCFPGRLYTTDGDADALRFDAALSADLAKEYYGEISLSVPARLVQLGMLESTVITAYGDELTVPTHGLKFADGVDAGHLIAYVYAPRTGEASVRANEGSKGEVILKAKAGSLVAVLQYDGGNYTKILLDGLEGYIRTDCLVFRTGKEDPLGKGVLHIDGNKDGTKSVTVRADAATSYAKVGAWKSGSEVTVHRIDGDWYLVEQDGWTGHVQRQYVTLIQN